MSKENPFSAALVLLREFLGVRTLNGIPFDGASLVPALNVLEAAGRVDKLLALASIDAVRRVLVNDGMPGVEREMRDIRALLSALPDKELR
jgi:hypothetical protein